MRRAYLIAAATVVAAGLVQSCSSDLTLGRGFRDDDAGVAPPSPSFTAPDAEADVVAPPESIAMCVDTECPPYRATCGDGITERCETDLLSDDNHCGACGRKCGSFPSRNQDSKCTDGVCRLFCNSPLVADCNGISADGCEAKLGSDNNNCGACGVVCPEGQQCNGGQCAGCATGTQCPIPGTNQMTCVDTRKDDNNCGACGIKCNTQSPMPGGEYPPNSKYGCGSAVCDRWKCKGGYDDCDRDFLPKTTQQLIDLGTNGCEVDLTTDTKNCGRCGNACASGQICASINGGPYQCVCGPGETVCWSGPEAYCAILDDDPKNCGACHRVCPSAPGAEPTCQAGVCGLRCLPNRADCNGDLHGGPDGGKTDGCEVDLMTNMNNCGSCGSACDVDAGQPCINGVCNVTGCDAGDGVH